MIIGWYIDQVDGTECPVAAVGSTPRRLCFKTLVDASEFRSVVEANMPAASSQCHYCRKSCVHQESCRDVRTMISSPMCDVP